MVEIPTSDDLNLPTGNHYFPPDTIPEVSANYFRFLEKIWIHEILVLLWLGSLTLLGSTGYLVCLRQISIITRNLGARGSVVG
jgi:hypothetical protein